MPDFLSIFQNAKNIISGGKEAIMPNTTANSTPMFNTPDPNFMSSLPSQIISLGNTVSNVVPGIRAGIDSITQGSTQPLKDYIAPKAQPFIDLFKNPVDTFKKSSIMTGLNSDGTRVTPEQISKNAENLVMSFFSGGGKNFLKSLAKEKSIPAVESMIAGNGIGSIEAKIIAPHIAAANTEKEVINVIKSFQNGSRTSKGASAYKTSPTSFNDFPEPIQTKMLALSDAIDSGQKIDKNTILSLRDYLASKKLALPETLSQISDYIKNLKETVDYNAMQSTLKTPPVQNIERAKALVKEANDIANGIISKGKEVVMQPRDSVGRFDYKTKTTTPNITAPITKTDSRIIDNSIPQKNTIIYHSTDKVFKNFDLKKTADGSVWFTDNKMDILDKSRGTGASATGNIIERVITKDLKMATPEQFDTKFADQLIQEGYDGVFYPGDKTNGNFYQIFNPNKLKKVSKGIIDTIKQAYNKSGLSNNKGAIGWDFSGKKPKTTSQGENVGKAYENVPKQQIPSERIQSQGLPNVVSYKKNIPEKYSFGKKLETLQEKKTALGFQKEYLKENPLSNLEKYVAKSGDFKGQLPEVTGEAKGRGLAKVFSQKGDDIITKSFGQNADTETIRSEMDKYLQEKEQLKSLEGDIKNQISKEKPVVKNKEQGARAGYIRGKEIGTAVQKNINTSVLETIKRKGELKLIKEGIKIRAKKDAIISDLTTGILKGDSAKRTIQEYITENLPISERGKFITMVRTATTDKDIAKAFIRVDARVEDIARNQIITDVKKIVTDLPDNVNIDYKNKIKDLMSDIELKGHNSATIAKLEATQRYLNEQKALGKDVSMPERILEKLQILSKTPKDKLTTSQLEGIRNEVDLLKKLGQTKERTKTNLYNSEKEFITKDIVDTAKELSYKEVVKTPGKTLPFLIKGSNKVKEIYNRAKKARLAIRPIDGVAELTGMDKMKSRFDVNYGNYLDHNTAFIAERDAVLKKTGLKKENMERIGIYGAKVQDGGYEKLANLNITKEMADSVVLTPAEQEYYDFGRKWFESDYEGVKSYMNDVYNKDVGKVKNYVSFQTDFNAMNELEIYDRFGTLADEGVRRTKTVKKDFTETRAGSGNQKIRINFDDILLRHKDNVAYMLNMGRDTKMFSEVINTPEVRNKLGDLGTLAWKEWLDLMARKGGIDGAKQVAVIDMLRRNIGVGVMSFKLSSAMIQVSSLADAAATIGSKWTTVGAFDIATSKAARQFVLDNFPEIRQMMGDDMAFLEMRDSLLGKVAEKGLYPLKVLDGLMRSTTAIGTYKKIASERGIAFDMSKPDKSIIAEVTKIVRQSQGSSSFKDSPLAISKGFLTGNLSVDKAFFQFQSFMLNRWENIERQVWRQGFAKGDYKKGISSIMWLFIVAGLIEEGARRGSRMITDSITGNQTEENPVISNLIQNSVGNVPIVGNVMNSLTYDSNPVPVINTAENILGGLNSAINGKETNTKIKGALTTGLGLANTLTGVPGTTQLGQLVKPIFKTEADISKEEKSKVQPIYDQVQQLKASGNTTDAQSLVDSLSEADYATYKKIKASVTAQNTIQGKKDILPVYNDIQSLIKSGNSNKAQQIVDGLSEEQYKNYKLVKADQEKISKAQEQSDKVGTDGLAPGTYNNQSFLTHVINGAKAIGTDPVTYFNRVMAGEKVVRVKNGTVYVERMPTFEPGGSEEVARQRAMEQGVIRSDMRLDHTIPLELGGDNSKSNLKLVPTEVWASYTDTENAIGKALRAGKITKSKAQQLITEFKNGKLTAEQVANML